MPVSEEQGRYLLERLRRSGELTTSQVHELLSGSQVSCKYNNPSEYIGVRDVEMFLDATWRKGLIEKRPPAKRGKPGMWRATNALNLHLLNAKAAPQRVSLS